MTSMATNDSHVDSLRLWIIKMSGGPTVLSDPNANPNPTLKFLTLTISLTRFQLVLAANYGRWWSGVVGADFNQTVTRHFGPRTL